MNGEHTDVTDAVSSVAPSQSQRRREAMTDTYSEVVDRSPAAVRRRVIADLQHRIAAVTALSASASLELDAAEVEQCEDVHRLAELLKLRLASVSPRVDETIDDRSGLVTYEATDGHRQVPMYQRDGRGRFTVRHYVNVSTVPPRH